jgi:epoxyqueuosine reductase
MGNRIFGCDDCLAVCPWNKFASVAREAKLSVRAESDNPPLAELLKLDDPAFRARFRGTPIKRTGRDRFLRNVLIAAGNSGDETLVPQVEERLSDASPLVRAMAVWALSRLVPDWAAAVRESEAPAEADPAVADEWARIGA